MQGVIFNLAEQVVTDTHGADLWDEVLETSGVEGAYTSLGSYPDAEFVALVAALARRLGVDPTAVVRQVGEGAMPLLAQRYPQFFAAHSCTRSFLLTLNDIIHPEVRKLYPGADVPEFTFQVRDQDVLVVEYSSRRQLCSLAEGFVHGAATHYGERVNLSQPQCMLRGADTCLLHCVFTP
jgi:DNA-binding transcriptional regulator YdaS (Cro superfamily)